MKPIYLWLYLVLMGTAAIAQDENIELIDLQISPFIDTNDVNKQEILSRFKGFLEVKNTLYKDNPFWVDSDFERYVIPYYDIIGLEYDRYARTYEPVYPMQLMELFQINETEYLIKIGYSRVDSATSQIFTSCLYNIVAEKIEGEWYFKRSTDYFTKDWSIVQKENITYYLPPGKEPNLQEVESQLEDIHKLTDFFEWDAFPITYYSCNNPVQMMQVKGFDYHVSMYLSRTGGAAALGNIVYSGNNSEFYTHEIVHLYMTEQFRGANLLLNEGIATYFGGSGLYDYQWHKQNMKEYLKENDLNFSDYLVAYNYFYINDETPVSYMVGALICEKIMKEKGKEYLFEVFRKKTSLEDVFVALELNQENLNEALEPLLNQ